jgi:shikimate dehydrogenase
VEAAASHLESEAPKGLRVERLGWRDQGFEAACHEADLVVNCTPIGMLHGEEEGNSPLSAADLRPGLAVCDLVYNPLETPLLRLAAEAGARPIAGLEMLIFQAEGAVKLWTGREPPVEIMRRAARAGLGYEA